MLNKLAYILLPIGVGGAIGGLAAYLCKRKYETWALDEINAVEEACIVECNERIKIADLASREIYELREACHIILDAGQYETILEQVKYKMRELNEADPKSRVTIEQYIDSCKVTENPGKGDDKRSAVEIAEDLGYIASVPPEEEEEKPKRKRKSRPRKKKVVVEEEEVGDMPPLSPNGDVLDEIDTGDDEDGTWTTEAQLHVSGDDIVRDMPYIITEWQFTYGKKDYSKVSVQYLCLDDTVLDEDDTELDQKFIGPENLRAFETDECDSIFIRNDQLEIDYEIMWVEASYTHDYLRYPEAEVSGRRIWRPWEKE